MPGAVILQRHVSSDLRELAELLTGEGFRLLAAPFVPEGQQTLEAALRLSAQRVGSGLVLTIGGSGIDCGDDVPEALAAVCRRQLPGIPEAIRGVLAPEDAMLFCGGAGLCGSALIIALPGRAPVSALRAVLPALEHPRSG